MIFDAEENKDFDSVLERSASLAEKKIYAGCAGLAACIAARMSFRHTAQADGEPIQRLLAVCGSVNPITQRQLQEGERAGCVRCSLGDEDLFAESYPANVIAMEKVRTALRMQHDLLIDSLAVRPDPEKTADLFEAKGKEIARRLGLLVAKLQDLPENAGYTTMIIGGDTLTGYLQSRPDAKIGLDSEAVDGVVSFTLTVGDERYHMLSKSGGFGGPDLFSQLLRSNRT